MLRDVDRFNDDDETTDVHTLVSSRLTSKHSDTFSLTLAFATLSDVTGATFSTPSSSYSCLRTTSHAFLS